ncbi:hypothetical protein [Maridesulfovibrio zosterae]|uniref:hypothetical protein n=1 Tax=Maridesulfovibrio zosterae TaxID=82171 RepID=UPI0004261D1D|nr:hypothetical protein [Maridesulfovibrio zosterae]
MLHNVTIYRACGSCPDKFSVGQFGLDAGLEVQLNETFSSCELEKFDSQTIVDRAYCTQFRAFGNGCQLWIMNLEEGLRFTVLSEKPFSVSGFLDSSEVEQSEVSLACRRTAYPLEGEPHETGGWTTLRIPRKLDYPGCDSKKTVSLEAVELLDDDGFVQHVMFTGLISNESKGVEAAV